MMHISQTGIDLIKSFEGLSLTPYLDGGGVKTIGYGHTGSGVKSKSITREMAEKLLIKDLTEAQRTINLEVSVTLNQNQFDALMSLVFNIGSKAFANSTLLKELNAGHYPNAANEFMRWHFDNGASVPGLLKRRTKERDLFIKH